MKRTETTSNTETPSETMEGTTMSLNTSEFDNPGLTPAVQKHIGNLLKVSFQDLLTEPVPDRFASLLEQLEQAEKKAK